MFNLLFAGIVLIILISAFIIIIRNNPDLWFWIFLNLYFDPGGYAYGMFGVSIVGPLHISDVFILCIIISLISAKINWKVIFFDQLLKKFLIVLLLFAVYYFVFYGGIVPLIHNDLNYTSFLIKNRLFAYGIIILISVYFFSLRGLHYFYTTTLFIGIICITLFLISVFTGLPLTPVVEIQRYTGEDITRIGMLSFGLFHTLFPVSLIAYLLSKKNNLRLRYKNWLYIGGVLMVIVLLITLTRRTQINIIFTIIIISVIISYILRIGKLSTLLKVLLPAFMVIIILSISFPPYVKYVTEVGKDTFLLITTGMDSRGATDQRVSGDKDYELVKGYINNNLLLGAGWTHLYWEGAGNVQSTRGRDFAIIRDAAGEVPIYYLFFSFGLIGAVLLFPAYFILGNLFFRFIKLMKMRVINFFDVPLMMIYSIYFLFIIAGKFTFNLYNLGIDFSAPGMGMFSLIVGLGLAMYRKITWDYDDIRNL